MKQKALKKKRTTEIIILSKDSEEDKLEVEIDAFF